MSEKRILVVEQHQFLSLAIGEFFSTQAGAGYSVCSADSATNALGLLQEGTGFDLVVSDHKGPGNIDGIELMKMVRDHDIPVRVVLVAGEQAEPDRKKALSLGCVGFVQRPFPMTSFLEFIFNMLQPQQGFAGRIVGMHLEDVIQMFCYRKESTCLTAFDNGHEGSIYVRDGSIVHAEFQDTTGIEAFYEILGWETGEFVSHVVFSVPQQTVFVDWQSLLMEGLRQKDEIRHALGPVPVGAKPFVYDPEPLEEAQSSQEAPKRVMIVDDSRFIRKIVQEILQWDPGVTIAGYAANGQEALAKIDELKPDLILLDWDMPVMKGSTTLMHIMIRSPCPVIILSGFAGGVGANPIDLLCLGGVDFIRKPQNNWRMDGRADDLIRRVKQACSIKFDRIRRVKVPSPVRDGHSPAPPPVRPTHLVVMGASLGGCADLIRLIPTLPEDFSAAVVVIHDMQQETMAAFVDYLNRRSKIHVRQLESGTSLSRAVCYLHSALVPVELIREQKGIGVRIVSDLPTGKVFDHFLVSASKILGNRLVAVLLSGGADWGVQGMRAVKQVEGVNVAIEPASSVDPRMAEKALEAGIIHHKSTVETLVDTLKMVIR